jgi:hypothetical protein
MVQTSGFWGLILVVLDFLGMGVERMFSAAAQTTVIRLEHVFSLRDRWMKALVDPARPFLQPLSYPRETNGVSAESALAYALLLYKDEQVFHEAEGVRFTIGTGIDLISEC